jgi:hypothetical protein
VHEPPDVEILEVHERGQHAATAALYGRGRRRDVDVAAVVAADDDDRVGLADARLAQQHRVAGVAEEDGDAALAAAGEMLVGRIALDDDHGPVGVVERVGEPCPRGAEPGDHDVVAHQQPDQQHARLLAREPQDPGDRERPVTIGATRRAICSVTGTGGETVPPNANSSGAR